LHADAVALHRLDDWIGHGLPGRRASHHRGQLTGEVHPLFGQHRHPGAERLGDHLGTRAAVDEPDAFAVVATPAGLEHDAATEVANRGPYLVGTGDHAVARAPHSEG